MRSVWFAGLFAALGLAAGCNAPAGEATGPSAQLSKGVAAYKAGDREGLHEAMDALGDYSKDPGDDPAVVCSAEAFAQRRADYARVLLKALDKSVLFSMKPEARKLYLDATFMGGQVKIDGPVPEALKFDVAEICKDRPEASAQQAVDTVQMARMLQVFADTTQAWQSELETEYGANLPQRITAAGQLLRANHLESGL